MKGSIINAAISWVEKLEMRTMLAHIAPDANFGNLGDVKVGGSLLVTAVTNDKILDVTPSKAVRLNSDGTIDSTFNDPGVSAPPTGSRRNPIAAVIDGQELVIGGVVQSTDTVPTSNTLFARVLNLSDGAADTNFGSNGLATIQLPDVQMGQTVHYLSVNSMLATPDGGVLFLVVQSSGINNLGGAALVMYKFTAQGALDSSFGANGQVIVQASNSDSQASAAIDSQGRILVVQNTLGHKANVTRYQTDGSVDTSFGTNGTISVPSLAEFPTYQQMKVGPGDKIYFTIEDDEDLGSAWRIGRLNADGSNDTGFNQNAHPFFNNEPIDDYQIDSSGNVVVISGEEIARMDSNGALDSTFDDNGIAAMPRDSSGSKLGLDNSGGFLIANSKHTIRLISRDIAVLSANGTLSVATTEGDDDINVQKKSYGEMIVYIGAVEDVPFQTNQVKAVSIEAGPGNNSIITNVPGVSIKSGRGNDTIQTGDGNNSVDSGDGRDTITTGNGDDDISFLGTASVNSNGGDDIIFGGNGDEEETSIGGPIAENVTVNSGDGNDQISFAPGVLFDNTHSVTIDAGPGNDHIDPANADAEIHGGDGNDVIVATGDTELNDDSLYGEGGNDIIHGPDNASYISGGGGKDHLYGGGDADSIVGGEGNDIIQGFGGADTISGQGSGDKISGGDGNDVLGGGDGNDVINGGNGSDYLTGDSGRDTLNGDSGDDRLFGGADGDHLFGDGGNNELHGEDGNDLLDGGLGHNTVHGNDGSDTIYANNHLADTLFGDAGRDTAIADKVDQLNGIEIVNP